MKILFCFLFCFSLCSNAETVRVSPEWTTPAAYTDGSVLTPDKIKEYRLFYAIDNTIDFDSSYISIVGANTFTVVLDLPVKSAEYIVSMAVIVVDINDSASDPSNILTRNITVLSTTKLIPNPVGGFYITVECYCIVDGVQK